ncbi:MAG TPA: PKD domain-containing protein [Edaphocola sp.]|nr:PKD domain-containing protein [Edaphocola sp.]
MKDQYKKIPFYIMLLFTCCWSSQAFATIHVIDVGGSSGISFVPSSLTVTLGDTIKWEWDNGSHTTTSTNIPAGAASWDEAINSSNLSFTYVPTVPGDYDYKCTPHASLGMVGSFSVICAGLGQPAITPSGNISFCAGTSTGLLTVTGASGASIQWKLNGAPISGATSDQYLPLVSGTYSCTIKNLCGDSATSSGVQVAVMPSPEPLFTFTANNMTVNFTNTTVQPAGLKWLWQFGDGDSSLQENPQHLYNSNGTYTVMLTATDSAGNGCSGMVMQDVTIGSTGIYPVSEKDQVFLVSPNPVKADGVIRITNVTDGKDPGLRVFDLGGRLLAQPRILNSGDHSIRIKLGDLAPGNYLLEIIDAKRQVYTRKINVMK